MFRLDLYLKNSVTTMSSSGFIYSGDNASWPALVRVTGSRVEGGWGWEKVGGERFRGKHGQGKCWGLVVVGKGVGGEGGLKGMEKERELKEIERAGEVAGIGREGSGKGKEAPGEGKEGEGKRNEVSGKGKGKEGTGKGKEWAGNEKKGAGKVKGGKGKEGTGKGKEGMGKGKEGTGKGKEGTGNGKEGMGKGKEGTGKGKEGTGKGKEVERLLKDEGERRLRGGGLDADGNSRPAENNRLYMYNLSKDLFNSFLLCIHIPSIF